MCVSVGLMIFSLVFFRFSFHIRCKANLNLYNYTTRPYDEMKNESCELKISNLQVHKYLGKLSRLGVIKWSLQPRRNKKKTQPVNNINCHNFVAIYLLSEAEAERCMFTVQSRSKYNPNLSTVGRLQTHKKMMRKKAEICWVAPKMLLCGNQPFAPFTRGFFVATNASRSLYAIYISNHFVCFNGTTMATTDGAMLAYGIACETHKIKTTTFGFLQKDEECGDYSACVLNSRWRWITMYQQIHII